MSEKVKRIKPSALIKIEVGAVFYQRIQFLLMSMIDEHDQKKALETLERLKKGDEPNTAFEVNLITVLSFIHLCEEKAEEQGLMEIVEIDPNQPDNT